MLKFYEEFKNLGNESHLYNPDFCQPGAIYMDMNIPPPK
jgi:hypothetical protein